VGVNDEHREGKQRYLVCHDYGMGGLWWWVWARSAAEIVQTCAEVEVVTDPDRVYLRFPPAPDDAAIFLSEHGPDSRRLRQVEQRADGVAIKTDHNDWPLNPPFDLFDPQHAGMEISQAEFEQAWGRARPISGGS
jgi:hypothetical protein